MSKYRNTDTEAVNDYMATNGTCRFCGTSTPNHVLSELGARCSPCFDAYVSEANPSWWPNRRLTHVELASVIRKAKTGMAKAFDANRDPRQWARTLRDREQAGERLSIAQKSSWRTALQNDFSVNENGEAA